MSEVLGHRATLGVEAACAAFGLSRATFYRHQKPKPAVLAKRVPPPRALSSDERSAVLAVLHEPRFVDQAPLEVYATLLDEERYLCSPRTMYRILGASAEVRERRALQPIRRGLDGRAQGVRRSGTTAHLRDPHPARHRGSAADHPRRPRNVDAVEGRRPAAGRPRRDQDALAASRLQRQPVLGGRLQDAEIQAGLPRQVRESGARPRLQPRLLRLVQRRAPPLGARVDDAPRRPLRARREPTSGASTRLSWPTQSASREAGRRRSRCPRRRGSIHRRRRKQKTKTRTQYRRVGPK